MLAPSARNTQQIRTAVPLALIALNFLILTAEGLNSYFNPDDTTNLYGAWSKTTPRLLFDCVLFWTGPVRPVGNLLYRLVYDAFGFRPEPFHITCFAFLLANIGLCWILVRRISDSWITALLTTALFSFHGSMWSIYASTGTIYHVACQTFYLGGLLVYVRARRQATRPGVITAVALLLLTVGAIGSKEMGFMLPFVALAYELVLERGPHRLRWVARVIAPSCLASVIALLGLRFAQNGIHFTQSQYTPVLSLDRALQSSSAHLSLLLFRSVSPNYWQTLAIFLTALVLAIVLKNRIMIFGWMYYHAALIPLTFTEPREDGYVLYIPIVGAALYVGAFIVDIISRLVRTGRIRTLAYAAALIAIVAGQWRERSLVHARGFGPGGAELVWDMVHFAQLYCSAWPRGQKFVVANDPIGDRWQPQFIFALTCGRRDLEGRGVRAEDPRTLTTPGTITIAYVGAHYEVINGAP